MRYAVAYSSKTRPSHRGLLADDHAGKKEAEELAEFRNEQFPDCDHWVVEYRGSLIQSSGALRGDGRVVNGSDRVPDEPV